jgi:hypothetical protein
MTFRRFKLLALVLCIAIFSLSCGRFFGSGVRSFVAEPFPEKLSEWRLFLSGITPNKSVVPYDLKAQRQPTKMMTSLIFLSAQSSQNPLRFRLVKEKKN